MEDNDCFFIDHLLVDCHKKDWHLSKKYNTKVFVCDVLVAPNSWSKMKKELCVLAFRLCVSFGKFWF